MSNPIGDCVLDHYERYLGTPSERRIFDGYSGHGKPPFRTMGSQCWSVG